MENNLVLRPSYWANVSGGKDSLYMLKLILNNPDKYPLTGVVHFELEIDYPFIKNVIDYMENECIKHGIKFLRFKPDNTWMNYYNKNGFPSRQVRWCNSQYKMSAKRKLEDYLLSQGCYLVSYIGYCFDEQARYDKRIKKGQLIKEVYPLVDNEIYENDILKWARTVPLFNDFYKYNDRCGCMFCPLQSMKTTAYLLKYYPESYDKMIMLAKETEKQISKKIGRQYSVWQSNGKYDTEYRDKIIKEKYLEKLK